MNWTKEQREAIESRNRNILVAAAAGSGKTAVLVERIKRLILEEQCSVDRMLVVTFTNAAAAEMKEKIRRSISDTISDFANREADEKQLAFLKKQMDLLATANISTFHSFALEVIRRYFYLIDAEPNFKICDNTQEALLKSEAMDELLDELFEEGSPAFFRFLKCYSGDRDEKRFRDMLDNCYNTIRSLPEPFMWLRESVSQLKGGEGFDKGPAAEYLFEVAKDKLTSAQNALKSNYGRADDMGSSALRELCRKDAAQLQTLDEALKKRDYEILRSAVKDFKLPTLSSKIFQGFEDFKASVTENRNIIKKSVKSLKDVYFAGDLEQLKREMALTYESAKYLEELLVRYDAIYKEKKAKKNVVDFSDIEHCAYEILKDEEASRFYRERFEHIFIDEYQDSNVIQEALIDLIKRPDNLFMVGDVKQSIYKFRLAEPEIFQNKYRNYKEGRIPRSEKIDLNKNFRSKAPVIDFINEIFGEIMDGYDSDARLYKGDPFAEKSDEAPKLYLTQVPWREDSEIDEELKNIMKAEKEAMAAAKIIRDNLGTTIFDSKKGSERPLQRRDIVILMRGVKNYGDIFYKVLTENNLPAYIDDNDGFFNTMEIDSFLSALYIIDNPKQDIHLLTLLRSEMMSFSIEDMVKVRIEFKEGSYYDAFSQYAANGSDICLRDKCSEALQKISHWRDLSKMMPLDQLIWRLLLDTGFYIAMGAMPAGSQRQANLRALTDKALAYGKGGPGSLYDFIRYIEAIKEKKVSMGQVKLTGEKDDLIRIMTVHKSKGLEFPMVIVAGFCRRLNYSSAGKAPVIHKDMGIGFPIVDPENRWYRTTLLQNIIKERFHKEEVEEEKRILYVALTRAKDKLALLGICNDADEEVSGVCRTGAGDGSYFDMTGRIICSDMETFTVMGDEELLSLSKAKRRSAKNIIKVIDDCKDMEVSPEIERLMTFEYPYEEELNVRTKYSVSQLNNEGRKNIEDLKEPQFVSGEKNIGSMGRGTIYHSVLEHMDIAKAQKEGARYVQNLLEDMVQREMLTRKESEVVDVKKVMSFAESDLAGRIVKSPYVCKEKRFNFMTEQGGSRVMVRGIIDCFFEEDGELVIVDYKTGNSRDVFEGNEDNIRERYRIQMELYREALEAATQKHVREMYLYLTDRGKLLKM